MEKFLKIGVPAAFILCVLVVFTALALGDKVTGAEDVKAPLREVQAESTADTDTKQWDDILKLQRGLMKLGYLEQENYTGEYDIETLLAVALFQKHNELPVNGIADEKTMEVIYDDDTQIRTEKEFSILAPTTEMSFAELVGDNGLYDYPQGYPQAGTYKITVDIAHQVVMIHKKDISGEYTVPVRYMLCSSGARGRTPIGTFKMNSYRVRFGKFVNDGVYGQYWSQIYGAFYFHTILYSKKDAGTYTTTSYKNLGRAVSHGCVRLTVPDARFIWYNIAPGTVCEIRKGSKDDAETAAIREKLVLAELPSSRENLEAGRVPYTDNWRIEDVPLDIPFVQGSQ